MKIARIIMGVFSAFLTNMKKIAAERKFRRHVERLHDQSDHFNKYFR